LIPDLAVIDADSLVVTADVTYSGKPTENRQVVAEDNTWLLKLPALEANSEAIINFHVIAKSPEGHALSPDIKPIKITADDFKTAVAAQEQAEPAVAEEQTEEDANSEEPSAEAPVEEANWLAVSGIVFSVNLLLGLGGYFVFRILRNSYAEKQQKILERLS
jgi:hypothetical protein